MSDAGLPNTAKRFAHFDNPASSDSGSSARKGVGVRVPASAPNQISSLPWNPTQLPRSEVNISQRRRQVTFALPLLVSTDLQPRVLNGGKGNVNVNSCCVVSETPGPAMSTRWVHWTKTFPLGVVTTTAAPE